MNRLGLARTAIVIQDGDRRHGEHLAFVKIELRPPFRNSLGPVLRIEGQCVVYGGNELVRVAILDQLVQSLVFILNAVHDHFTAIDGGSRRDARHGLVQRRPHSIDIGPGTLAITLAGVLLYGGVTR